jgi:hypothetical protein
MVSDSILATLLLQRIVETADATNTEEVSVEKPARFCGAFVGIYLSRAL